MPTTPEDQKPHALSSSALAYVTRHADEINRIADVTGASGTAIALSVGRELTRNDLVGPIHKLGHSAAEFEASKVPNAVLERDYAADRKALKADPRAFDGNRGPLPQFENPTLADVGPGHVKLLTAFALIDRNAGTLVGRQLELDRYGHDRAAIVRDLEDADNSLSLKVAGLMVRDGQAFLGRQQIVGRFWSALDGTEKDAALVAYYTLGESAVATEIAANSFRPSGGGPTGGWVTYGTNRADVQAILGSGACRVADAAGSPRSPEVLARIAAEAEQRVLWMASVAGPSQPPPQAGPAAGAATSQHGPTRGLAC